MKIIFTTIFVFLFHNFCFSHPTNNESKKEQELLKTRIVGIWQTRGVVSDNNAIKMLDYKNCNCLKHRSPLKHLNKFNPTSYIYIFRSDGSFSLRMLSSEATGDSWQPSIIGKWSLSLKNNQSLSLKNNQSLKLTYDCFNFVKCRCDGVNFNTSTDKEHYHTSCHDDLCEREIVSNAQLTFNALGNIERIDVTENLNGYGKKSKSCTGLQIALFPVQVLDNNDQRVSPVFGKNGLGQNYQESMQNLISPEMIVFLPKNLDPTLLLISEGFTGVTDYLGGMLLVTDNKFTFTVFNNSIPSVLSQQKKISEALITDHVLWRSKGIIKFHFDEDGSSPRISFNFTSAPEVTDLLQMSGIFTADEFARRVQRIMLPENALFCPGTKVHRTLTRLYDMHEEFPELKQKLQTLLVDRLHIIDITMISCRPEHLKIRADNLQKNTTKAPDPLLKIKGYNPNKALRKEETGLTLNLTSVIPEFETARRLAAIDNKYLTPAVGEMFKSLNALDNPPVDQKEKKEKKKKRNKKRNKKKNKIPADNQNITPIVPPKIASQPTPEPPAPESSLNKSPKKVLTPDIMVKDWKGWILAPSSQKSVETIELSLSLQEDGRGTLQSDLRTHDRENELQGMYIKWSFSHDGEHPLLMITTESDLPVTFNNGHIRLPKLHIRPQSTNTHLMLADNNDDPLKLDLTSFAQAIPMQEPYYRRKIKEKTQNKSMRLEQAMGVCAARSTKVFKQTISKLPVESITVQAASNLPPLINPKNVIDDVNDQKFSPYLGRWTGFIMDKKNNYPRAVVELTVGAATQFVIRDLVSKDVIYENTIPPTLSEQDKKTFLLLGRRKSEFISLGKEKISLQEVPHEFEFIDGELHSDASNPSNFSIQLITSSDHSHLIGGWHSTKEQPLSIELFDDFTGHMLYEKNDKQGTKTNRFVWAVKHEYDHIVLQMLGNDLAKQVRVERHDEEFSIQLGDVLLVHKPLITHEEPLKLESNQNDFDTEHFSIATIALDQMGDDKKLIKKNGFNLLYSTSKKAPLAVSYRLTRSYLARTVNRLPPDAFMPDPDLLPGERAENHDFFGSRWDRGHMAPSGDMLRNAAVQQESFYLSNIVPQQHDLNNGLWANLEALTRFYASRYENIQVITGPLFEAGHNRYIGDNNIAVPDAFYKIIFYQHNQTIYALAFLVPNISLSADEHLENYLTSIKTIEEMAKIKFDLNCAKNHQNNIKDFLPMSLWH